MTNSEQQPNKPHQPDLHKTDAMRRWLRGGLSEVEYYELLGLEYVLTWNYTDDIEKDERRYKELSDRKWAGRANVV